MLTILNGLLLLLRMMSVFLAVSPGTSDPAIQRFGVMLNSGGLRLGLGSETAASDRRWSLAHQLVVDRAGGSRFTEFYFEFIGDRRKCPCLFQRFNFEIRIRTTDVQDFPIPPAGAGECDRFFASFALTDRREVNVVRCDHDVRDDVALDSELNFGGVGFFNRQGERRTLVTRHDVGVELGEDFALFIGF